MKPEAAVEALKALHVAGTYTVESWPEGIPIERPCCMVCATNQGWPCQTKRILDEVTA